MRGNVLFIQFIKKNALCQSCRRKNQAAKTEKPEIMLSQNKLQLALIDIILSKCYTNNNPNFIFLYKEDKPVKKMLSTLLTFLLAMSAMVVFSSSVSASSGQLSLSGNTASALPGGSATVTFSLENNPGFSYLSLTADYDGSVMTLKSAANKNLFDSDVNYVTGPSVAQKPYRMIWSSVWDEYSEGELISLTFTVAAKASPGTYPVTVKVTECSDEDGHTVATVASVKGYVKVRPKTDSVASVSLKKKPTKMTYEVGDRFDPSGMALTATYSDNMTAEITEGFTCTPSQLTTAGQQKIVATFGGKSTGFYVTVKTVNLTSITLKSKPTRQTYTVGDAFDPSGMVLKANFDNGKSVDVTDGFTCTPSGRLSTIGQQKIVVSYGGKSTGFYVTVNKIPEIVSISVNTKPAKQVYMVGESFSSAGMKLTAFYDDGTKKEVTSGFTCTPSGKLNTVGQQKIVVSYGGKSTGFYVTVNKPAAVSSVAVKTKPAKQHYVVGESFSSAGMKLTVSYDNGTRKEVTSGFTCTPSGKLNTVGQQKIIVSYGGKSTGFYVTVNTAGQTVSSIAVKSKPAKQVYAVGESFAPAGLKLTVTYANNTTAEITSGFACTPSGKLNTVGQQKIVVSYGGKSAGFYVTVGKAVSSVALAAKPSKQVYAAGDTFNPSGMKLKVTYTDNTTKEVTSGFACTPSGQLSTVGQQKIVVSYDGKSTGFYVTVNKKVTSVAIKSKPGKLTYHVGDTLVTTGMKLTVKYSDNTSKEVTSGFTCTPTKLTTGGTQVITVRYGDASASFGVTVNRTVTSVTVKSKPSKLTYVEGSTLNTSGLKLTATYDDHTSREITSGFTCSPTKLNTIGTQKITVHYGSATTTFNVTVTEDPNLKTINVTRSYTYAYEVLKLVNQERSRAGVTPPLKMDASLLDTAMMRSGEIVLLFSHTRPDGSSCFTAFHDDSTAVGENIAAGYQTPAAVVEGWMNSPGHKANILNPEFTTIGIGCIRHDSLYQIYWAQCFGNHLTSDVSVNKHTDGAMTQKIKIDPSIVNG